VNRRSLALACLTALAVPLYAQVANTPEARLAALGLTLPAPPKPVANYVEVTRTGNLLFLAGHGPCDFTAPGATGKVGRDLTVEQGAAAARLTALCLLATLKAELGELSRVKRVVKVLGMVNATDDFTRHPQVINGASDLLVAVFGERGRHARSAVGVASLPVNIAVEIEIVVEVEEAPGAWRAHDASRPRPPVVMPARLERPVPPPADAVVLFDGTSLDGWRNRSGGPAGWRIRNGAMEAVPGAGYVFTRRTFGDVQLHVEWAAPTPPKDTGQGRGNSGVFLMEQYEVQVLDSYRNDTYADGQAGAVYGQYPPLVNASLPPGEWQHYDIIFRRPRFDSAGGLRSPARMTVLHNGIPVQEDVTLWGPTNWLQAEPYRAGSTRGSIGLQDHGNPVRYRNIWARELPETEPAPSPGLPASVSLSETALDRLAGAYASTSGMEVTITRAGSLLWLELPEDRRQLLVALTDREFALTATAATLSFELGADGAARQALFRMGDTQVVLDRQASPGP
jgi:enamine deaminase RidA (YjgF/YER057c/UK114 family)